MVWTVTEREVAQYMTWSLILWDYLITLDDEVRPYCILPMLDSPLTGLKITLFWFSKRSWIKFLFFANRYMGLVLRIWDIIWEHLENADELFSYHLCEEAIATMSEGAYEACAVVTESASVLYVTMQLLVIESILVLRIWAIMGKRRWILCTFFVLLVCSTAGSIVLNVNLFVLEASLQYVIPTLIFEAIIFVSSAYHVLKESGGLRSLLLRSKGPFRYGPEPILRLVFQGSVLYFIAVLCSLPVMGLLDPRLGITIMSVTTTHMLLRLRKKVLSDTVGSPSQKVELTTFRATTNGTMPLEVGEDVIDIRPDPQGS
ncbi:hypothetical protein ARMGADRAFT_1168707 [Armillaria gallica]|uniref:DUF6533 domain-containing protein n=1 Tax=Armillaria gallica TaxID=47427 RepID=A0A2H3DFS2_ARMGA|nr:hypothetical protein ARMGADRAFT_1168707 [Armillaria gallica]